MRSQMISFVFISTDLNNVPRLSFNYLATDSPLRELLHDDVFDFMTTDFLVANLESNSASGFIIDKLGAQLVNQYSFLF